MRNSFAFYETSDEEEGEQMDLFEKDTPPDRIGVFDADRAPTLIRMPTHFLDLLWNAGLVADGVLSPVRRFDPVGAVGIDMNDNNPSVARRDQLGLVEAGAVGLVGGLKWRRLGKQQCAGAAAQGAQAEHDQQTGEYGCRQQKRHQAIEKLRPIGIGVEEAKAQRLQVIAQEQLELLVEQDRKTPPNHQSQ
jgi:hypothetical protein